MGRLLLFISAIALICLPSSSIAFKLEGENTLRQFRCDNGNLIQAAWKCDGEDDCQDNSDESDRECRLKSCGVDQFRCASGLCIPIKYKCDGENDCGDRSDENPEVCKNAECAADMFECEKNHCIPKTWLCDDTDDCLNGMDEKFCNKTKTCSSSQFQCNDLSCVDSKFICDGDNDCADGSDEKNCNFDDEKKICHERDFACFDGKSCIPAKWKCDGEFDCLDHSDELKCNKTDNLNFCKTAEFQCADQKTCIHNSWVCDGTNDCPDGDDENKELCANSTCPKGFFECHSDKTCIPGHLHCNGVINCQDGSDEEECKYNPTLCLPEEFHCGSTDHCVHLSRACDGIKDCPGGEDESPEKCYVNECKVKNGGCQHICVDTVLGHKCECRDGYKLVGNSTCEDVNECATYGACSHNCHNHIGSYTCSCKEGYVPSPTDHRRCQAKENNARLIYTRRTDIISSNLEGNESKVIIKETSRSQALDFDYKTGYIFWSETKETEEEVDVNTIFRAHISQPSTKSLVIGNVNKTDNIAVDWIYDHIYWTDTGKNTIEVSNFDGSMRKVVIGNDLDEPRALAVDPMEGWLFWSDWGKTGKIERSELDGSNRMVIVVNTLKWPNGIALDFDQQRLYWVDAKLNSIYSVHYDGSTRKEIKHSPDALHHPFSLTLFADHIYWTDWDTQAIYRADKFDGSNMTSIMPTDVLHNPMVVHVHHPFRQPRSENHCLDSGCAHFCFPRAFTGEQKFSCGCSDGFDLLPDKKSCSVVTITTESVPVTIKTPKTQPPIIINYQPNDETAKQVDYALMIILIVAGTAVLIVLVAFLTLVLYRLYLNGNIKIMNFDNPMYKKAATRDPYSAYNIEAQLSYPSTPSEEVHQPLTSTLTMESTVYQ